MRQWRKGLETLSVRRKIEEKNNVGKWDSITVENVELYIRKGTPRNFAVPFFSLWD